MSHSAELLSLFSEVVEHLAQPADSLLCPDVLCALAPKWPVELLPQTIAALRDLGLSAEVHVQLLQSLSVRMDKESAAKMLRIEQSVRPALTEHLDETASHAGAAIADIQRAQRSEGTDSAQRRKLLLSAIAPILTSLHIDPATLTVPRYPLVSGSVLRWRIAQLASPSELRLLFSLVVALLERSALHTQGTGRSAPISDPNAGEGPDEPTEINIPTYPTVPLSFDQDDELPPDSDSAQVISCGFSAPHSPCDPLPSNRGLLSGDSYLFWFQIGNPVTQSIEQQVSSLPKEYVEQGAVLKVVLFSFPNELIVDPATSVGILRVSASGKTVVVQQPMSFEQRSFAQSVDRLFFPVSVPTSARPGQVLALRCNLYCNQVLLQSRLISVDIVRDQEGSVFPQPALRSVLDYSIADEIGSASALGRITPHKLSVLLNDNADGSHSFRFFGSEQSVDVRHDALLDDDTLRAHIRRARGALRKAAWGDEEPWKGASGGQSYRYAESSLGKLSAQLCEDLIPLAVSGSRFYVGIIRSLTGGVKESYKLQSLMRTPGFVQIASKVNARHMVPAALLYDHPLDDGQPASAYRICLTFRAALERGMPLEACDCFSGNCPSYDQDTVICPSGFWGFRHFLGMPLTGPNRVEPQPQIRYQHAPQLGVGISLNLREFAQHEKVLRSLRKDLIWQCADSAAGIFSLMQKGQSHVVYFYCHGGVVRDMPYLEVGKSDVITPSSLYRKHILWEDPRPLVFLNGCHTTALDPEQVMDLVTEFIEIGQASGVIGTEITIFEPLARAFAEECLGRFFAGQPIGQAIRGARLQLLQRGNPLGLAYDPFVLATVCLSPASS